MIRRTRRQRAQGIIEFAVIFPIFMMLIFAVIDGGLVMGRYGEVNHAAAEGARYGAVQSDNAANVAALIVGRVAAQAPGGSYSQVSCGSAFDAAATNVVCVTWQKPDPAGTIDAGDAGSALVVMVKYHYTLITPLVNRIGSWDITACATETQERAVTVVRGSQYDGAGTTCGNEGTTRATATAQAEATADRAGDTRPRHR